MNQTVYENIDFLPIDLPKIDVPGNLSLNFSDSFCWWKMLRLTYQKSNYQTSSWLDIPEWRWLQTYIMQHLPISTIVSAKVNLQIQPCQPHIDFVNPSLNLDLYNHNKKLEPCGYRILLRGARDSLVINKDTKTFLPEDTDIYCIRHTETLHRTNHDENRLIVFIHAWIDMDRHYEILDRSIRKYSNFIIQKKFIS